MNRNLVWHGDEDEAICHLQKSLHKLYIEFNWRIRKLDNDTTDIIGDLIEVECV